MTPKEFQLNHLEEEKENGKPKLQPNLYKPEHTSLEKMGFVMGSSQNQPMKRTEDLLSQILGAVKTKPGNQPPAEPPGNAL